MREVVLAVDIGGTKTAAALADRADALLRTAAAPTPASAGPAAVVATVAALAQELLDEESALVGVGIGTAGVSTHGRGRSCRPPTPSPTGRALRWPP